MIGADDVKGGVSVSSTLGVSCYVVAVKTSFFQLLLHSNPLTRESDVEPDA
jgi:hypothetical protein